MYMFNKTIMSLIVTKAYWIVKSIDRYNPVFTNKLNVTASNRAILPPPMLRAIVSNPVNELRVEFKPKHV